MANTYKALSTVTVGAGGAANIQFTNIPQTYTDLVVKLSPKTNRTDANYEGIVIALNSDATDGNYGSRWVGNDGTGAVSGTAPRYVGWTATNNGTAPNVFGNFEIYFPNYASANKKSFAWDSVNEGNFASVVVQGLGAISWTSTNPITSISLTPVSANNLMQYSTATLYGVFNADVSSAPATPTIGTASVASLTSANVAFTSVSNAASYTATSTPGSITGTSATSPITVSGLTAGTSYTFKVKSNNPFGSSSESAASNSIVMSGYESIATTSVGAGGSSGVTFSSLPTGFTHLQIRALIRTNRTGYTNDLIRVRFNGDTATNYDTTYAYSDGTGAATAADVNTTNMQTWVASTDTALTNVFAGFVIDILDFQNTNKWKTISSLGGFANNGSGGWVVKTTGKRRSTTAVTSITLTMNSGTLFNQYSHFALYGIRTV